MSEPLVAILMGSETDLEVMKQAAEVLAAFGVPHELRISSAHRMPDETFQYARSARERGLRVLIAGAGMAAHLPGVVAAATTLPVVGVPLSRSPLRGVDALHAIVQMPPGIPVATVAIDGARNAAHLALEILALQDEALAQRLGAWREAERRRLEERNRALGFVR
jgi:phosphoribosylaminoimidazole carboxylase PurE protein